VGKGKKKTSTMLHVHGKIEEEEEEGWFVEREGWLC
jgi:hypothetical protein